MGQSEYFEDEFVFQVTEGHLSRVDISEEVFEGLEGRVLELDLAQPGLFHAAKEESTKILRARRQNYPGKRKLGGLNA